MSLEEEINSHYEDGLLSQNSPEEMGGKAVIRNRHRLFSLLLLLLEDPLFKHFSGNKNAFSFPSSQELVSLEQAPEHSQTEHDNVPVTKPCGSFCVENQDNREQSAASCEILNNVCVEPVDVEIASTGSQAKTSPKIAISTESQTLYNKTASKIEKETTSTDQSFNETASNIAVETTSNSQFSSPKLVTGLVTVATQTDCSSSLQINSNGPIINQDESTDLTTETDCSSSLQINSNGPITSQEEPTTKTDLECGACPHNITSENLTMALERHRRSKVWVDSREACRTRATDEHFPACSIADTNSVIVGESKAEGLLQRISELEERALMAESTIIWQTMVIRALQLDKQYPLNSSPGH